MPDELRAEQAAWSGRGMARPVRIPASVAPRHSRRALSRHDAHTIQNKQGSLGIHLSRLVYGAVVHGAQLQVC